MTDETAERQQRIMNAVTQAGNVVGDMFDKLAQDEVERIDMDLSLIGSMAFTMILALECCPCDVAAKIMNVVQNALSVRGIASTVTIPEHSDGPEGTVH